MNPTLKWIIPIICLMLIWASIFALLYLKADEVTKDPCSICSKKMGKNVMCTQMEVESFQIPAQRIYYPNGTIYNVGVDYKENPDDWSFNFSNINISGG